MAHRREASGVDFARARSNLPPSRSPSLVRPSSLAVAPAARANGRFPAANQLEATPGNDGSLVLRTTFGILFSNDGAKTWDWVGERGVGYGGTIRRSASSPTGA
ncbi:MAG: hypothetical protein U0235_31080 [Polyangiaceae bacterium]